MLQTFSPGGPQSLLQNLCTGAIPGTLMGFFCRYEPFSAMKQCNSWEADISLYGLGNQKLETTATGAKPRCTVFTVNAEQCKKCL